MHCSTCQGGPICGECERKRWCLAIAKLGFNISPAISLEENLDDFARWCSRDANLQNGVLRQDVYSWLGFWRDKVPVEAVMRLQDILGPLDTEKQKRDEPESPDHYNKKLAHCKVLGCNGEGDCDCACVGCLAVRNF